MRIIISEFMDEQALAEFGRAAEVVYDPGLVEDRRGLRLAIAEADGLIVRNRTRVDADLLSHAPMLKAVGRLGVGLDNIDLEACRARGIAVLPATGANTVSVAEYVICAAMSLVRGAYQSSASVIAGEWPRAKLGRGGEIAGRSIGLIGFGAIGQAVARRGAALGMTVRAADPLLPADDPAWQMAARCDAEALIGEADILSLHVPLTDSTRNMIGQSEIAAMRAGAILINTARGGIVDEKAVAEALKSGHLGGAALDVFEEEPLSPEAGQIFADAPNLILTPHISGVSHEANIRVSQMTVRNMAAALKLD